MRTRGRKAGRLPRLLLASLLAAAATGCRAVWVHDCWYAGRYEEESAACQAQQAAQRAEGVLVTPWKDCMVALGWKTEIGRQKDVVSKPTRGRATLRGTPRRSLAREECEREPRVGER